jgi:hypothetical protein
VTAALVLQPRTQGRQRRVTSLRPEPEVLRKARLGEETALAQVFDVVVREVYGAAFTWTSQARKAERITDRSVARLPQLLRSRRWSSVEELSSHTIAVARAESSVQGRRAAIADNSRKLRAWSRHIMLASTGIIAASYAVLNLV